MGKSNSIWSRLRAGIDFFRPPPEWQLPVLILSGVFVGVGLLVYQISNASAYLSERPEACINCHVMVPQYANWRHSSHRNVATCVDCHVPHDNVAHKYYFKMNDGLRHATIFTARAEPQVIRIKPAGEAAVQENCIRCHESLLEEVSLHHTTYQDYTEGEGKLCWECHRQVPHGRVRSLAATPYTHVPDAPFQIPEWFKDSFNKEGEQP